MRSILSRLIVIGFVASSYARGETVRLPVTRDTWFSNVGSEADGNTGASPRLKLKSNQEMSLVDFDVTPLRGRVIKSAILHVKSSGPPALQRVTVSSFGAEWFEGTSNSYSPEKGASTHNHKRHPDVPWTVPGSDLCAVMLGQGGTTWRMAEATPPDAQGWQTIAVDPAIVAARVAGISYGFLLFDDTGTTWKRDGEKFTSNHFPNRFVMSRDSNRASAPYLTVVVEGSDNTPPDRPIELMSDVGELPAGEAWISWRMDPKKTRDVIGFDVSLDGANLPRYLIPVYDRRREWTRMRLRDLGLDGETGVLTVRAVDAAGNRSEPLRGKITPSKLKARELPPALAVDQTRSAAPLPKLGTVEVAIVDELDKVRADTGELIPAQSKEYLASNHLWDAKAREIRLRASRNEFIGFQVLIRGKSASVVPSVRFENNANVGVTLSRYFPVNSKKGPIGDPLVPLLMRVKETQYQSFHVDLYVTHDMRPGGHRGTLTLEAGGQSLSLPIVLNVWNLTLPDQLSFLPEMNCYGLPENERDYYRLAHAHRVVLNRLPYLQNGTVHDGCAPRWDGKKLDWSAWDRRFGPYLDGSAFADLPRKSVPIELFYLPLHENWPTPIDPNYNGNYWADHAFTPAYAQAFQEVSRQIAVHVNERKWNKTFFHAFLNNKVDFKSRGWSRGSSPWLLDEPSNFQDYWALRFFGALFHQGIRDVPGNAKLVFRADISRPQWQRDSLDGLLDYNVVGGAMRKYHRMVIDRKEADGQVVVEYGSANAIEDSNVQAVAWSLDAWSLGVDGVLPWQTIGRGESWTEADPLALFYPVRDGGPPMPSIRLKAFRRGQQDVEYLDLYARLTEQPRWAVGQKVREALGLAGERKGTGLAAAEDAGVIHYGRMRPGDDWTLRERMAQAMSGKPPFMFARPTELRTPRRNPVLLGQGGEVSP